MGKSVPPPVCSSSVPAPAGILPRGPGSAVFPGGSQGCLQMGDAHARVGTQFALVSTGLASPKPRMVVDGPTL
jgi:hypothetical protein